MEKQIEYQGLNKTSQRNFVIQRLGLSIASAIFTGVITYVIVGFLKNRNRVKDTLEHKVDFENLPENNPEKIDAGKKIFKVREAIKNKWNIRARRRFITG